MIAEKVHYCRVHKKSGKAIHMSKFREMCKKCVDAITQFHADKELKLIENGNLGSFCNFINSRTSYKSRVAPFQHINGVVHANNAEKANLFNEQFANAFANDNDILPDDEHLNLSALHLQPLSK